MTPAPRHDEGFTLVELLVSLALLSLMTVYALNAFSVLRDMNRIEERIGAGMEVEAVARYLRDSLADVRPVLKVNRDNVPELRFKGSHDSLEFVSASNGDRETGGLYLVRLAVDAEGTLLAERWLLGKETVGEPVKVVLLRGVKGLSFKYLALGGARSAPQSLASWELSNAMPAAIEVIVEFDRDDRRAWPVTLIRLRAAQ